MKLLLIMPHHREGCIYNTYYSFEAESKESLENNLSELAKESRKKYIEFQKKSDDFFAKIPSFKERSKNSIYWDEKIKYHLEIENPAPDEMIEFKKKKYPWRMFFQWKDSYISRNETLIEIITIEEFLEKYTD